MNKLVRNTLRFIKSQNDEFKYIELWNPKEKKFTEIGTILAIFVNIAVVKQVCKTLTENKQELTKYYESNSNIKEN